MEFRAHYARRLPCRRLGIDGRQRAVLLLRRRLARVRPRGRRRNKEETTMRKHAIAIFGAAAMAAAWGVPAQAQSTSGMTLRSEEHTSELQSLMRISYAVFC